MYTLTELNKFFIPESDWEVMALPEMPLGVGKGDFSEHD